MIARLLLLFEAFDATADDLVKGDAEAMEKPAGRDVRPMRRTRWMRVVRAVGTALLAAAVGTFCG